MTLRTADCISTKKLRMIIGIFGFLMATFLFGTNQAEAALTDHFVTTWKTDNPGTSSTSSITIPTFSSGYNYDVDWDNDGTFDQFGLTGNVTHDFGGAGTYTIRIQGTFPRIYFNNTGDRRKILSVDQWGTGAWTTMEKAFFGCENLNGAATDAPVLTNLTSLKEMFRSATTFNADISNWNLLGVLDMTAMFQSATAFNQNIGSWNVSSVTNMSSLFYSATAFNQDISSWDVSSVTTMANMFLLATNFNQAIGGWTTTSLQNTSGTFRQASNFNKDISGWDMSGVTSTSFMFYFATSFNQDISTWDVSEVLTMTGMFQSATNFNQSLNGWVTTKVNNMASMFSTNSAFNSPIGDWDVSSVITMESMFYFATNFNQDISGWTTTSLTNMKNMFQTASSFDQNIGGWNVSGVKPMDGVLYQATLSVANYDALLIGWGSQILQNSIPFNGGYSKYCDGAAARASIISTYSWTFVDGGEECPPEITITAPTKADNVSITDTTINVTDNIGINAVSVTVSGSTTATTSSFVCLQTSATEVDCTISIDSSGDLVISATNTSATNITLTESSYIIETTPPVIVITAPTKSSNAAINDTSFVVTDNNAISTVDVSVVAINTTDTFAISIVNCIQTTSVRLDCTVQITDNDGTGDLQFTVTDSAGNQAVDTETGYTIDTTAPDQPIVTTPVTGTSENNALPTFTGTGEVGATVSVDDSLGHSCTAIVDGLGDWTCDILVALTIDIENTFSIIQTDVLSNISTPVVSVIYTYAEPVVNDRKTTGSVTVTVCKDQNASNYSRFGRHNQSLCKYTTLNNIQTEERAKKISQILLLIKKLREQIVLLTQGSTGDTGQYLNDLDIGSKGTDVILLQNFLISKGYSILAGPTGYFGKQTQNSLSQFQKDNGITPSVGYFGPKTRSFINN